MNKDIKLIATDLDGTFLNNESEISPFNKEIFDYLANNGVEIILSTGRPFEGMVRYKRHLNNKNNSIVLNGAIITDSGEKFIYDETLDEETALKVMEIYKKYKRHDIYLHVYSGNKYIASEEDFYFRRYANKEKLKQIFVGLHNIESFEFSKMLFIGEHEILERLQEEIRASVKVHTSFSHTSFLEILRDGINKGTALKWLCEKKGIERENVIAFGDNYNDIEMIEFAGVGVAMENGEEEVKQRADYIASDNHSNGVGKFLKDFLDL